MHDTEHLTEQEAAGQAREAMIELLTAAFDQAAAYTNLIMLGGYAGAFTLWAYTLDHLSQNAAVLVALLLGISLAIFVFFEIYKMAYMQRKNMRQVELLTAGYPPREFLSKLRMLQQEANENKLKSFMRVWAAVITTFVSTGLGAVVVLFYNFFAILMGLPIWPAG